MTDSQSQTPAEPLVSVYCMTYNHETTIAQTIEGIVSQQTDFPFELIIHDDASTDGTAAIVREYAERYPHIIRPVIQAENQYRRCNLIRQFIHPISKGKWIALCEGDDFWTDPQKLQIQVDYMRAHPDCTLCFHAVEQLSPGGEGMTYRPCKKSGPVPGELIIKRGGMFCPTVSQMIRRDVMDCWPTFREAAAQVYDYPLQVLAVAMGTVHYIDRMMGTYRFGSAGSWTEQHADTVNIEHVRNEIDWLELYNQYTDGKYRVAIDYHMAHLWLTEYRKNFDPSVRKKAKPYVRRLPFRSRILFTLLFLFFRICGPGADRLFRLVKRQMLK